MTSPEVERNKVLGARGDVSNARPIAYKAIALPTELQGQIPFRLYLCASGRHEAAPGAFAASQAVFQPPTGTSHASFPRLRDVVLQRHTQNGADSRPRTDDIEFGKLTLYPLSYVRKIVRLITIQSLARPHGNLLKMPCTQCDDSAITAKGDDCISAIGCWFKPHEKGPVPCGYRASEIQRFKGGALGTSPRSWAILICCPQTECG